MKSLSAIRCAVAGSLLILSLSACGRQSVPEARTSRLTGGAATRNLVLITVDTLRADRLGAQGHLVSGSSPSPHIDKFVASGVHFVNATAPRAITWPSLASVLTGLYPSAHGVYENGYELADDIPTLAKLLQSQGYQTGRFLSNMCSANALGWSKSFCSKGVDSRINPAALEWLTAIDPDRPFFLWVHYFGAHSPYYNGGNRSLQIDPGYEGPVAPRKGWLNRIMTEQIELGDADIRHLDALYDASVMGSDDFVGDLLRELQRRSLNPKSLFVFLADHGEDLYDHNRYIYHACSVYETGLHVPLAVAAPGLIDPGGVVRQSVELLDVAPTVLDLMGVEAPPGLHGVSLVPFLEHPLATSDGRPAFSEYPPAQIRTVRWGDWKLVDNPDHHSPVCLPNAPEGHYPIDQVELYNLAEDPLETTNLADQYPEKVETLRQLIQQRFADLPTELTPQDLPDELKEELEALGYVAN